MGLTRQANWPERLNAFINRRIATPFIWGEADCCLFVCDAVQAMTGTDPAARWRGLYSSEKGARRVMQDNGGVAGLANIAFGTQISPKLAQRGDPVLIDTARGDALAICVGGILAVQGDSGIEFVPMAEAKAAWHI